MCFVPPENRGKCSWFDLECFRLYDGLKMALLFSPYSLLKAEFIFPPLETALACNYFKQSELVLDLYLKKPW